MPAIKMVIIKESNIYDQFAVVLSACGVGMVEYTYLASFLLLCNTYVIAKSLVGDNMVKDFLSQKRMRLIKSTKSRKKECAYKPGALGCA